MYQDDSGLVQLLNYSCENIRCTNTAKVFISNMSRGKKEKKEETRMIHKLKTRDLAKLSLI